MKIALLQTGKTTDKNIAELADLYKNRIKKYTGFEILTIPEVKNTRNMPVPEQKSKESARLLQSINDDDYVILLDEKGREFNTIDFSVFLNKMFLLPKKRIVFIIGGPWGFSEEIYKKADYKMSLSKMTFPHQLVRLLLLEQLYRVLTIIRGDPYHHE